MGSPGKITRNYTIRKGLWGLDFDRTTGKWTDFAWRVVINTSSDRACDQLKVDVRGYTSRLIKIYSHGTKAGQKSNNSSFKPIISWFASRHSFLNPQSIKITRLFGICGADSEQHQNCVYGCLWYQKSNRFLWESTIDLSNCWYRVCPETGDRRRTNPVPGFPFSLRGRAREHRQCLAWCGADRGSWGPGANRNKMKSSCEIKWT